MAPKNWPKKFIYSAESVGAEVHIDLIRNLFISDREEDRYKVSPCIDEKTVHPHLEIRLLKSKKGLFNPHPLADQEAFAGHPQHGVFARKPLLKGADLGEYVGEISIREPSQEIECSFYRWLLPYKGLHLLIDSQTIANEMTFVNDFRGIAKCPNAIPKWILNRGIYYFGYAASRDIEKGEEILIDYGKFWAEKIQKGSCCAGSL